MIFILLKNYGAQFNGFIKNIIAIVAFLGSVEGALGAITVIFLIKPILQKDYIEINDILRGAKKQYRIGGMVGFILLGVITLVYGIYIVFIDGGITLAGDSSIVPAWQIFVIIIAIGSKNLVTVFWVGHLENLLQADQNNYIRRVIILIIDLVFYSCLFYMLSLQLDVYLPFLAYAGYSVVKMILIKIYVFFNYPWLNIGKGKDDYKLSKTVARSVWRNIGESLLLNFDFIIISLFLGFRISSVISLYMTIAAGFRSIMLILINSFREFFTTWVTKDGRVQWSSFIKFETIGFIIGGFVFLSQFILAPYFTQTMFGTQLYSDLHQWSPQELAIFSEVLLKPTFSLLIALISTILIISEPSNVMVYAKNNLQKTSKVLFILGVLNTSLSIIFALIFTIAFEDFRVALYFILGTSIFLLLVRYLYLSAYNWLYQTYNSSFKGLFQNWFLIISIILGGILFNYLYLNDAFKPNDIFGFNGTIGDPDFSLSIKMTFAGILAFFLIVTGGITLFIILLSLVFARTTIVSLLKRLPIVSRIIRKYEQRKKIQREKLFGSNFITLEKTEQRTISIDETEKILLNSSVSIDGESDVKVEDTKDIYTIKKD